MAAALKRSHPLTVQQVISLIRNVKSFPCIWKRNRQENLPRSKAATAWVEIAKRLQLPEDVVRIKWKILRDIFNRELKKTHVTSPEEYNGKWRHFRRLWFVNQEDTSEQVLSDRENSNTSDVNETVLEPQEIKTESNDAVVNEFIYFNVEKEDDEVQENPIRASKNSISDRDDDSEIYQTVKKRRRKNQAYTDDDCDMMFLKSLTPYFKLLTPMRKLIVRNKMQEMLFMEIERNNGNQ